MTRLPCTFFEKEARMYGAYNFCPFCVTIEEYHMKGEIFLMKIDGAGWSGSREKLRRVGSESPATVEKYAAGDGPCSAAWLDGREADRAAGAGLQRRSLCASRDQAGVNGAVARPEPLF